MIKMCSQCFLSLEKNTGSVFLDVKNLEKFHRSSYLVPTVQ